MAEVENNTAERTIVSLRPNLIAQHTSKKYTHNRAYQRTTHIPSLLQGIQMKKYSHLGNGTRNHSSIIAKEKTS